MSILQKGESVNMINTAQANIKSTLKPWYSEQVHQALFIHYIEQFTIFIHFISFIHSFQKVHLNHRIHPPKITFTRYVCLVICQVFAVRIGVKRISHYFTLRGDFPDWFLFSQWFSSEERMQKNKRKLD